MIKLIESIGGPEFILLYLFYFLLVYIIMIIFMRLSDETRSMPLSLSLKDEGIMILLLRYGNRPGVIIKGIMMNLFSRKLLKVNEDGSIQQGAGNAASLTTYEKRVYEYYKEPKWQDAVLSDDQTLKSIQDSMNTLYDDLIRMKLVKSREFTVAERRKVYAFMLIFYAPGVIKLILGISKGKPVTFLVIILVASFVIFAIRIGRLNKTAVTMLGKRYLKELTKKYATFKSKSANSAPFPSEMQPALYMALFGASALLLFPEFGVFQSAIAGTGNTSYGCSGCSMTTTSSSGCSGCSSSDSGSGCGGSGCGGCGGGD